MIGWLRRILGRPKPPPPRVALSESLIRFENGAATVCLAFADLAAVVIETNDSGPWGDDVVWHLLGYAEGSGLAIPQTAENLTPLMQRLQQLPGFDNQQVVAAMGSTALNAFLCWEADSQVRPDSALLGFARFLRQKD